MDAHQTFDQVAKRTGLTAYTLRYYKRISLLAPVARAPSRATVVCAQRHGLAGISAAPAHHPYGKYVGLAALRSAADATIPAPRELLESHLQIAQADVARMQKAVEALQAKIEPYKELESGF